MDVADPIFDIPLALIVEKQVAQTARKHLEEHSYWDDTRRLTKLTDKHIAIPVTGQCGHALLNTEGNGNVSYFQSSDDQNSSCRKKAVQAESGTRTNITTLNEPPCCSDSPKKVLPTSQNLSSKEEANQTESGTQSLLSTPHNNACQCHPPKNDHNQSATPAHRDLQPIWCGQILGFEAKLVQMDLRPSKKAQLTTPSDKLRALIDRWVKEGRIQWKEELVKEIPKNWERHGDLILLPSSCFQDPVWSTLPDLWSTVASTLNCRRVARRGRIKSDDFRSPRTEILLGTDSYVDHIDNGIRYTFDIRYSMFSSGNITEKLRIADLDCSQETVVDLYAGIGYFTLPYLVHAKARMLYACEWNPHAVQALRKNLQLNRVNDRCVVLAGDNREVCPKGVADRVNLGLIPSSEQGWPVACAALNPTTGGILHIHGNVSSYPNKGWTDPTTTSSSQSSQQQEPQDLELLEIRDLPHVESKNSQQIAAKDFTLDTDTAEATRKGKTGSILNAKLGNNRSIAPPSSTNNPNVSGCQTEEGESQPTNEVMCQKNLFSTKLSENCSELKRKAWVDWGCCTVERITQILCELHGNRWSVELARIEHVKSYAPHIDHLVVDLKCRPIT